MADHGYTTKGYFEAGASFEAFYDAHSRQLLIWFARQTLDTEAALDLTAETFAQAYASRARLRSPGAVGARSWLYGIASNQLGKFWRRGRVERRKIRELGIALPAFAPSEHERLERAAELAELRAQLASALDTVPARHREAIALRVVDDLSYEEIAVRLGISTSNARARVSRGLRALASEMQKYKPVAATSGEVPA